MKLILPLIATALVVTASPADAGNCHHLYRQHHAVHHVQAVVVQSLYFAGQATQDEAIIRKGIRAELPAIVEAVRQQLQAPALQQTAGVLGVKCGKCHTGDTAKGGVDFSRGIDAETFRRSIELLGTGKDTPTAMKGVIAGLSPQDKGSITEELLNLSARPPAVKPEPTAVPPEPEPGVLR